MEVLNLLDDIKRETSLPVCRILSLALDIPEIFDISDKYLNDKLGEYGDTLQFNDRIDEYEDDEEDPF